MSAAARWALNTLVFVLVAGGTFIPFLFLFALTPLHDGSDVPGPLLFFSTCIASLAAGILAAWWLHRVRRRKDEPAS